MKKNLKVFFALSLMNMCEWYVKHWFIAFCALFGIGVLLGQVLDAPFTAPLTCLGVWGFAGLTSITLPQLITPRPTMRQQFENQRLESMMLSKTTHVAVIVLAVLLYAGITFWLTKSWITTGIVAILACIVGIFSRGALERKMAEFKAWRDTHLDSDNED